MIKRLAALILLSTLSLSQALEVPHQMSLTVAERGDDVILTCTITGFERGFFYWYKQNFGYMVQTGAQGTFDKLTLVGQFDNSRFRVTAVGDEYFLTIRNASKEDEATYFCQSGSAFAMAFINGTLLAVNEPKNQQKSVYVKQSPDVESVQLGDSVTLQCSLLSKNNENSDQCPGEHRVHWFRAASDYHPGFIYTDSISSDEHEERSCVYRLSKTIQSSSDAGTYYCAVVTCGEILFGEGTKVDTRQELCPLVIVLGMLLACCVLVNIILILTRKQKPVCEHCKGEVTASYHAEQDRSVEDHPNNVDGEEGINYVALDFPSRKPKRWKDKRELPEDCLYSDMRDYQ